MWTAIGHFLMLAPSITLYLSVFFFLKLQVSFCLSFCCPLLLYAIKPIFEQLSMSLYSSASLSQFCLCSASLWSILSLLPCTHLKWILRELHLVSEHQREKWISTPFHSIFLPLLRGRTPTRKVNINSLSLHFPPTSEVNLANTNEKSEYQLPFTPFSSHFWSQSGQHQREKWISTPFHSIFLPLLKSIWPHIVPLEFWESKKFQNPFKKMFDFVFSP